MKRVILLVLIVSGLAIIGCACAVASAGYNTSNELESNYDPNNEVLSSDTSLVFSRQSEDSEISSALLSRKEEISKPSSSVPSGKTESGIGLISQGTPPKSQSSSNTNSKDKRILEGDSIHFSVGISVNIHASSSKQKVKMAKTYAELETIYKNDDNPNQYNYIEKYNDSFFDQKAVIVLFITEGSGSNRIKINSLINKGNILTVCCERILPDMGTCDMAYWRILLEVNKSEIENVIDLQTYSYTTRNDINN